MANRTKTQRSLDASFLQLSPTRMSPLFRRATLSGLCLASLDGLGELCQIPSKILCQTIRKVQSRNSLWLRRCSSYACENNYPDVSGVIFPTIVAIRCCFSSSFWPGWPL